MIPRLRTATLVNSGTSTRPTPIAPARAQPRQPQRDRIAEQRARNGDAAAEQQRIQQDAQVEPVSEELGELRGRRRPFDRREKLIALLDAEQEDDGERQREAGQEPRAERRREQNAAARGRIPGAHGAGGWRPAAGHPSRRS